MKKYMSKNKANATITKKTIPIAAADFSGMPSKKIESITI